MGGKSVVSRPYSPYASTSNQWAYPPPPPPPPPYTQSPFPKPPVTQSYAYSSPYQSFRDQAYTDKRNLERKYSIIDDKYYNLSQVRDALESAGLESSNLIIGVDFTKSNKWRGSRTFRGRSLHYIGIDMNPYEEAISIIGRTLASFDEENLIPCFGFGDVSTHDQEVFSFYPGNKFCDGFEDVLRRYRELAPQLQLAGPTSLAPIIEMAITIVEKSGGRYHVLLIIADGQVIRSVDTDSARGQLSPPERRTVDAIVKASKYPLSIVLVGVGDGPWDMMEEFDDYIPARAFDNFQDMDSSRKEAEFSLSALRKIPSQYKATIELNILGARQGNAIERISLPPPCNAGPNPSRSTTFQPISPTVKKRETLSTPTNYHATSTSDNNLCPICLTLRKDMTFGCGHRTCCKCGTDLQICPICKGQIRTRIKLY